MNNMGLRLKVVVVLLAAMLSCVTADTCGPCNCHNGTREKWKGLKVAVCELAHSMTSVPGSLPADIQALFIHSGSISKLAEGQFRSYRYLQKIEIVFSKISQIEQGTLRYMTDVTNIDLFVNQITELPSDFFTYTPNLIEVDFTVNKIKRLQTNLFKNLKYLKKVLLRSNEITTIEDNCFANVPQLEQIGLNNNKLISLDVNFIDNTISLKQLRLHINPWHCDAYLYGIIDTVVNGSLWEEWPVPTCATPQNLADRPWSQELQTELRPCFPCQCTKKPPTALCTKPHQLNNVPTDLPTDLVQLNLTGQQIPLLQESDTIRYTRLEELSLENNHIRTLEATVFNQLKNLTSLLLSNNNLTALNKHQFANLLLLKIINVSHNNIHFVEEECFYNLPSLERVDLSRNKLEQLSLNFMDNTGKLKSLLLHENPWHCDEALCGVMDTVVQRALWGTEEVPTCAAPADLRGQHWHQIADAFQPQIISNTTSVVEGHDLELKCKYCLSSRLVWTFYDFHLPSSFVNGSSDSLTSTLTVKNIRNEQHGYYLCRVKDCEGCKNDGIYVSVTGKTQSDFDVKQVLHVSGVNSSESCSSRRGFLLLHYNVVPDTALNTTHSGQN